MFCTSARLELDTIVYGGVWRGAISHFRLLLTLLYGTVRTEGLLLLHGRYSRYDACVWWWGHFDNGCHVGLSHICHVLLALQWMLELSLSCQSDHQLDSNVEYRSSSGAINEVHFNCTNGLPSNVLPIGHAICLHSTLSQSYTLSQTQIQLHNTAVCVTWTPTAKVLPYDPKFAILCTKTV